MLQLGHGPRSESVAARLVAREHRAVDEEHVAPEAREVRRGRGAAGPRADDEDVGAEGLAGVRRGHGALSGPGRVLVPPDCP